MDQLLNNTKINKAGDLIREAIKENKLQDKDYNLAIEIIEKWRANHVSPLNTLQTHIRNKLKNNNKIVIAQRLKRMPSIISKIIRFNDMKLSKMQDIGGIRVIVKDIKDIQAVYDKITNSKSKTFEVKKPPKDYIAFPKRDGYRSLHQIFIYNKDNKYKGYRLELQIRTELQHAWATCVETIGMINKVSYKTGEGLNDQSREFLKYASALFSILEDQPIIEELQNLSKKEILQRLKELDDKLQIINKLESFCINPKHILNQLSKNAHFVLLELSIGDDDKNQSNKVIVTGFSSSFIQEAEIAYKNKEKETKEANNKAVVLVRLEDIKKLKKAYPNYFLDSKKFIKVLKNEFEN